MKYAVFITHTQNIIPYFPRFCKSFRKICFVFLHKDEVDKLLAEHCENWDLNRVSAVECNIMRVAVTEMCYFPDVPEIVSIDEAVCIARDFSGGKGGNFINGVLNAIKNTIIKG